MNLPLKYNIRNLFVRWRSTFTTVIGIALVVAVYVLMQALAAGLEAASKNTGFPLNVLVLRKGSTAESSSQITPEQFRVVKYLPQIEKDVLNMPMVSAEVVVLINLPRLNKSGEANVLVRGIGPNGLKLRPQVKLSAGRWFDPGKREVVVSKKLAGRFANFGIGQSFITAGTRLVVVGWLEGEDSVYDSEIWMDTDEARSIFDRENYSSVLIRVKEDAALKDLISRIESDKRLPLRAVREKEFYAAQTRTAIPIKILGNFLATSMSIGAVFAAMNTMYANVGSRIREIGTLRVLGYRRRTIVLSFMIEGVFLALIGGVVGCLIAVPMHGFSTGTVSFDTFSEVVFHFRLTPIIIFKGMLFAIAVGAVGSILPAFRAGGVPVINALNAV